MAEIKKSIFKKSFTTTPKRVTQKIIELCLEVNQSERPDWIDVKPVPEAQVSECFFNVSEHIKANGGEIVYGWAIWEWPRVFIEAEHHAIWSKNGEMIDITPKPQRERQILFLPDIEANYDFLENSRRINIKRSVGRYLSAEKWINATHDLYQAMESNSTGRLINISEDELYAHQDAAMRAMAEVILDLAIDTRPKDKCICISGREYRKCCSKLIRFG